MPEGTQVAPLRPMGQTARAAHHGARFEGGYLYVSQGVQQQGRDIGRLEMVVSMRKLYQRSLAFAGITALCALGALGLAYLFALQLRRDINETEARLDELAYVDAVSGLYNRHAAGEHMRAPTGAPAGTFEQVPSEPATLQALHDSVHAVLQQYPSTHRPLLHWRASMQA